MSGLTLVKAGGAAMSLAMASLVALGPGAAFGQGRPSDTGREARQFGLDAPAAIADLPAGAFRDRLQNLSPQARARALDWLQDFSFTEHDLDFLDADDQGGVLYVDSVLPEHDDADLEEIPLYEQDGFGGLTDICGGAPVQASGVPSLHSKPGSGNVLFLDLDGGEVPSGTAWGGGPYQTYPYDRNGDYGTVTAGEAGDICEIWLRVAEDFAPFDIDVTTEEPAVFDRYTGRVLITRSVATNGTAMPYQNAGGVAYVNVFGRSNYHTYYSPAFVYYDNLGSGFPKYVAEAASHEMGHNVALSHDGTNSKSYYTGHGSGATSWGPIMGVGYYTNMTQWSRGEYSGATQFQDDLAIVAGLVGYEPDDHGDSTGTASTLAVNAGSIDDWGLIETPSDVDVFSIQTSGGALLIDALNAPDIPNSIGKPEVGNLDIRLELLNAGGGTVAVDDLNGTPDAQISVNLSAGTYYLLVSGVGDSATPYGDYGSLGEYYLLGSVNVEPPANLAPNASFGHTSNGLTASFTDASSDSDGTIAAWAWTFGDGGTATAQNPSHTYAATGTYQVTLMVTDDDGATGSITHSVSVTVPDVTPPSITAPADKSVEATGPTTTVALGTPVVSDDVDPSPSVTANPSGPFPLGTTMVTWTATDAAGNSASDTQVITVVDTTAPTLTILGDNPAEVPVGSAYVDAGATAVDAVDGNLTGAIGSSSTVNTAAIGSYAVTYTVMDATGNAAQAVRTVNVVADTSAPAAPSGLTALVQTSGTGRNKSKTAMLSWTDNAGNETEFVIERCTEEGRGRNKTCVFSPIATVGANVTDYTDAAGIGRFHYRVKARNGQGDSAYSNEVKI